MIHIVQFYANALESVERLPAKHREQVLRHARALGDNPYPPGHKKLKDVAEVTYRIKSGKYRILYRIVGAVVYVVVVGDRKNVYRNL